MENLASQLSLLRRAPEREFPLTAEECRQICDVVESEFDNARRCMDRVKPILAEHRMELRSGAFSESVGKNIEQSVIGTCPQFVLPESGLHRRGERWELKVCKDNGLIINQCSPPEGEHYLVVNYSGEFKPTRVWVLWHSADDLFTERRSNSNMRTLVMALAEQNIQRLAWT